MSSATIEGTVSNMIVNLTSVDIIPLRVYVGDDYTDEDVEWNAIGENAWTLDIDLTVDYPGATAFCLAQTEISVSGDFVATEWNPTSCWMPKPGIYTRSATVSGTTSMIVNLTSVDIIPLRVYVGDDYTDEDVEWNAIGENAWTLDIDLTVDYPGATAFCLAQTEISVSGDFVATEWNPTSCWMPKPVILTFTFLPVMVKPGPTAEISGTRNQMTINGYYFQAQPESPTIVFADNRADGQLNGWQYMAGMWTITTDWKPEWEAICFYQPEKISISGQFQFTEWEPAHCWYPK